VIGVELNVTLFALRCN